MNDFLDNTVGTPVIGTGERAKRVLNAATWRRCVHVAKNYSKKMNEFVVETYVPLIIKDNK